MKKLLSIALMITTLFGCNKKANVNRHRLAQQDAPANSNPAEQWLNKLDSLFRVSVDPKPGYLVNIDLLGGFLPGYSSNKLKIQAEYGSTILDLGTPVWNNGYEYAGGWETSDGKPFNLTKITKIRKGLAIHPKIRFNKNLANDIENRMNVIFKKHKELEDVTSKNEESTVLWNNATRDLENNSQIFIETTVNLLKALTNSNKDVVITLRNKLKGINKLIVETRRYPIPNPYITDEHLRQNFAKLEIPSLVNLLNSVKEIEKNYIPDKEHDHDNYNLDEHLNQIIHYHELPSEEEKVELKHALEALHEHETAPHSLDSLDKRYTSPIPLQDNNALDKEYKEKAMALILQRNKFFNSNEFPFSTLGLNSYSTANAIKLLEALALNQDEEHSYNYKTSYNFYDIIGLTTPDILKKYSLLSLLYQKYQEYCKKTNAEEKKYEKKAYDEMKNIKDKRKAVHAKGLKGHLRADRDAIFEQRRKAEDSELQSTQTSDLNSSIKLKMDATAQRNVANKIEKTDSYLTNIVGLEETSKSSKTSLKESLEAKKNLHSKIILEKISAADNKAKEIIDERQKSYGEVNVLKNKLKPAKKSLLDTYKKIIVGSDIENFIEEELTKNLELQANTTKEIKSGIEELSKLHKYEPASQYIINTYKEIIKEIDGNTKKLKFSANAIKEIKSNIEKSKSETYEYASTKLLKQVEDLKSQADTFENIKNNIEKLNYKKIIENGIIENGIIENSIIENSIIENSIIELYKQLESLKQQSNPKIQEAKYYIKKLKSEIDISAKSSLPDTYKEIIKNIDSDINRISLQDKAESIKRYTGNLKLKIKKLTGDDAAKLFKELFKEVEDLKLQVEGVKKIKSYIKKLNSANAPGIIKKFKNFFSKSKTLNNSDPDTPDKVKSEINSIPVPDNHKKSIEKIKSNLKELKLSAAFKNINSNLDKLKNATDNSINHKKIIEEINDDLKKLNPVAKVKDIGNNIKKLKSETNKLMKQYFPVKHKKIAEGTVAKLQKLAKNLQQQADAAEKIKSNINKLKAYPTESYISEIMGQIIDDFNKSNFKAVVEEIESNINKLNDEADKFVELYIPDNYKKIMEGIGSSLKKLNDKIGKDHIIKLKKLAKDLESQADATKKIKSSINKLNPEIDRNILTKLQRLEENIQLQVDAVKKIESNTMESKFKVDRDTVIELRTQAEDSRQEAATEIDSKSSIERMTMGNILDDTASEIEKNFKYPAELKPNNNIEFIAEKKREERRKIYGFYQLLTSQQIVKQNLLKSYEYYENINNMVLKYQENFQKLSKEFNLLKTNFSKNYGDFPLLFKLYIKEKQNN
jgi:hypothetical protein